MKIAMQLTMDGLIRALRLQAHGLGEDIDDAARRGQRLAGDENERMTKREDRDGRTDQ